MADKPKPTSKKQEAKNNVGFGDAIVRRQMALQSFSAGLSDDIVSLLDASEADVRETLKRRLAILERQGFDAGPATTARLQTLANAISRLRDPAFRASEDLWQSSLEDVAKSEGGFIRDAFGDNHVAIGIDLALPTARSLAALVSVTPFQGKLLSEWADTMASDDLDRIMSQIRIGMSQGETVEQISRRIFGSATLDGADGIAQITRNNMRAVLNTSVSTITNEVRNQVFKANADVFTEEVFVATLDSRTTPICRAKDGQRFPIGEGPIPPLHYRCRSVRVALIGKSLIGDRPAVVDGKAQRLPASTNYSEFLKRQTSDFQDYVLGPSRAKLFRDGGLTLDKFVALSGKPYTLSQLRQREPAAFRRTRE